MYVCICNAVTDRQIRKAAAEGVESLRELRAKLGVAACCGRCAPAARAVLNDGRGTSPVPATALPVPESV